MVEKISPSLPDSLTRLPPFRCSHALRSWLQGVAFDRAAAKALPPPETAGMPFYALAGACLHTLRRARALGYRPLVLVAATSHVRNVARQIAKAVQRDPIERGWLHPWLVHRTLAEYAAADLIEVASNYAWHSFVREGLPAAKLRRRTLLTDEKYQPPRMPRQGGILRVVYVGSLSIHKGIPVLLSAFIRLPQKKELVLVGGWGTRGMRQYLTKWTKQYPEIKICPGDPLPHLQRASVCVHPAWEDGWAYAPAEALATGLPVICTADTGMQELIENGRNGWVVPTGSVEALTEAMQWVAAKKFACSDSPPSDAAPDLVLR